MILKNCNIIYIGYIGSNLYKFGKSSNLINRLNNHTLYYNKFLLKHVVECHNNNYIEKLFKTELKKRNLYKKIILDNSFLNNKLKINKIKNIELFNTNKQYNINYIIDLIDDLIINNQLSEIVENKKKINELENIIKYIIQK
jgi:hypothetical protein